MKLLAHSKIFAYIFYVLALLFGIYTIVAMVVAIQTIMYTVTSGMYGSVPFSEMLTYFFTQAGPFLFYACALFFCGYAIQLIDSVGKAKEEVKQETSASVEPASSYSATLDTEPTFDTNEGINDGVLSTSDVPDEDIADVIEEDVYADNKPVVDGFDVEIKDDDVPVVVDDADLTKGELNELEEGITEFDKEELKEGKDINDTLL